MRHFIYFSKRAVTTGNFDLKNLMKAGRMDIVIHVIIAGFFLSHNFRDDVKMHLVFYGPPTPPRHIEIQVKDELEILYKLGVECNDLEYLVYLKIKKEIILECVDI